MTLATINGCEIAAGADLRGADLSEADLRGAQLREAKLLCADLSEANLCGADLRGADLCGADLSEANLRGAQLREADLCGADLCGADLRGADLRGANLLDAYLLGTYLQGADLHDALISTSLDKVMGMGNVNSHNLGRDSRGYDLWVHHVFGYVWVHAGCRAFSLGRALAHWGAPDYPKRERGDWFLNKIRAHMGVEA